MNAFTQQPETGDSQNPAMLRFNRTTLPILYLITLINGFNYVLRGRIFLDAGFYLHAARSVTEGLIPYRDFFFVQGPVYPYIYGWFLAPFGHSVVSARFLSLIFAMLTLELVRRLARHWGGDAGGWLAVFCLTAASPHMYYFTAVKLYALTGCLITAVFVILAARHIPPGFRYSGAAVLTIAAAATRLTLVPAVPIILVYILWDSKRSTGKIAWLSLVWTAIAGLALSVPFLMVAGDSVLYYLLKIHTSAEAGQFIFGFGKQIRVLIKLALIYLPVTLTLGVSAILYLKFRHRLKCDGLALCTVLAILAVTAAHLKANWFSPGYQSILMPLTAALAGGLAGPSVFRSLSRNRLFLLALLVLLFLPGFFAGGKNIWPGDSVTVPEYLDSVGEYLRDIVPENGTIAGCNALFAIEADRPVAPPFGGAPFTFTPNWDDERCARYNGINTAMFIRALDKKTYAALIFQDDSFTMGSPGFFPVPESEQTKIFEAINRNYKTVITFPNIGNGEIDMNIYLPVEGGILPFDSAQGDKHQGLAQGDKHQGLAQGDKHQGLARGDKHQGLAQGDKHQGLAQGDKHQGFAQGDKHQGLAQGDKHQSFTQDDPTVNMESQE